MARLPYPDPESLPPRAAAALDALPVRLNAVRALSLAPTALPAVMDLVLALLQDLALSSRHRELLILQTAHHTGSSYEAAQHEPIARAAGISEEELRHLRAGSQVPWPDPADAALLRAGQQLLDDCSLTASLVHELRDHFSDRQIAEAVLVTGCYRMLAGLFNGLAVEIDPHGEELAQATGHHGSRESTQR
ncbi:4-carboxymuconolactone decarboxylase [Streptomyces sp. V4I8]|uniref:carboxymuconolactone decarboxylase family protein n=1 Tax=Streptomyces sp. V4I8 TaxID=3156469 RepID=UPI0035179047